MRDVFSFTDVTFFYWNFFSFCLSVALLLSGRFVSLQGRWRARKGKKKKSYLDVNNISNLIPYSADVPQLFFFFSDANEKKNNNFFANSEKNRRSTLDDKVWMQKEGQKKNMRPVFFYLSKSKNELKERKRREEKKKTDCNVRHTIDVYSKRSPTRFFYLIINT